MTMTIYDVDEINDNDNTHNQRANAISSNAIEGICNKRLMNLRLMRSKQMQSNANAISSTCNQGHMQSRADAFKG